MSGVLIHDSLIVGHRKWSKTAVENGHAAGMIVTPFATPRIAADKHPNAATLADDMQELKGRFIFDPMTHVGRLPTTTRREFYDQWDLWPDASLSLSTASSRADHVERVFEVQDDLQAPYLTPTVQLSNPLSADADIALELGRAGSGLHPRAWQSLAGTKQFWSSGAALDGYVGSLATLRSPVWLVTLMNDFVVDGEPDLSDVEAYRGLCRTVRSLSKRARVIICHSDYAGLPAVAAGADTIGSGWHRQQRTFDPMASAWHLDSNPGVRRQAENVTQGQLHAVLRRDTADQIVRWDGARADTIRGGPMPPSANSERFHHLRQLTSVVTAINKEPTPQRRFAALRERYAAAAREFDDLISAPAVAVKSHDKEVWNIAPAAVLDAYGHDEGF